MRKGGLEPPRVLPHRILNPARLPIPPLSRKVREVLTRPPVRLSIPRDAEERARVPHMVGQIIPEQPTLTQNEDLWVRSSCQPLLRLLMAGVGQKCNKRGYAEGPQDA